MFKSVLWKLLIHTYMQYYLQVTQLGCFQVHNFNVRDTKFIYNISKCG